MRALRGAAVFPVVALESRPMKTQFGTKLRPEFSITDWRDLGGTSKPALESTPLAIEGKPVTAPTTTETLDDDIPF
jgi:hypothetical protein